MLPAFAIYKDELLAPVAETIALFYIYIVGFVPKIDFTGACQVSGKFFTGSRVLDRELELEWDLPEGGQLKGNGTEGCTLKSRTAVYPFRHPRPWPLV